MMKFVRSLTRYSRRRTTELPVGPVVIGGDNCVVAQSMTDTDTNDIDGSMAQVGRLYEGGCRMVRLTVQGMHEVESMREITRRVRAQYPDMGIVGDVHFQPAVALALVGVVDKVRINPGNYRNKDGQLSELIGRCKATGTALRIGVNHGSLAADIIERYGNTAHGMVASAMEFLHVCRQMDFSSVVVSMKSSNTRVMVHACRLLVARMESEGMTYPLHLGVTETGSGMEGRIKSAVGIGALMADGLGDTIRVSLTEPPENEIPVARAIIDCFADRRQASFAGDIEQCALYNPYEFAPRRSLAIGRVGGSNPALIYNELDRTELAQLGCAIALIDGDSANAPAQWRSAVLTMMAQGDRRPVVLHKKYGEVSVDKLALKAAADFGLPLLDGLADGIWIECDAVVQSDIDRISLMILQAARLRMTRAEFIACPGCGRTLFELAPTLEKIKAATSHLVGLKIGVMGCIVNGPGEMADADYGYVGAGAGKITLYRGREVVRRNIPQDEALDALVELLKTDGVWREAAPAIDK